jgi:hypothetical protein
MRHGWVFSLVAMAFAGAVYAQTMPSSPSESPSQSGSKSTPSPSAPSPAEQMLNEMLHPATTTPAPTTRPQPSSALLPQGASPHAAANNLLREGSDVIARTGHLLKATDGPYPHIAFDPKPNEQKLETMYVLPNLQLMSMEDAGAATKDALSFTVSGVVTEYRGHNYILLAPGPDQVGLRTPMQNLEPHGAVTADQLLKDMLSGSDSHSSNSSSQSAPKASPLPSDSSTGHGALPPNAPVLTVLPERSQIVDRVARMTPSADGQQEELSLEADGSSLRDPPLIVLPNLKLVDLENASGDHHDTRFRVTGEVTEYRGRNYILLQKVVVMADSDRQF